MSILIKGMEMPKAKECFVVAITDDGAFVMSETDGKIIYDAIEIPDGHGRLIDANALMKEFEKAENTMAEHGQEYSFSFMSSSQEISTEWYAVEEILDNSPTIIPADISTGNQ